MRHRIFIAINLPGAVKKKLLGYQEKWPELPARWVTPENIHITLVFLGYVNTEEIPTVCETTKEVAERHSSFFISLNKVLYGPPKKIPPRMVWAEGERLKALSSLKEDLEKSLLESAGVNFSPENRGFSPHVTLARIREWEWRKIEPEERPEISEEINVSFPIESIEIMESELKKGGPKYTVLESYNLKD